MEGKLDLKDKKIFYLLTENARLRPNEIASKVGLSKNAVAYRINRLVKEGFIWHISPITDFQKIGVYSYDLFLKLHTDDEGEQNIKNYFKNHPSVIWAATLFGEWDLFAQIVAKDLDDFSKVLEEITIFLGNNLENYEVKFPIKRIKIDKRFFDYEKETRYKFTPYDTGEKIIKLDDLDKRILKYLNTKGAFASYQEVANFVKESLETTRNRMIALLKNGVIVRYSIEPNYEKLGLINYLVIANFHYLTKETLKQIHSFITHNNYIKLGFETIGRQEIYFYANVYSLKELEKLIKDFRNEFSDTILNLDYMLATEDLKLDFFPDSLINL